MTLERRYDDTLIAGLASAEKQVQQSYRPIIQVHKWFARRPGTLFRGLLLSNFDDRPLGESFFQGHDLEGVVLDPFVGGGTTAYEANRLGLSVVGYDTNPLSRWIVSRKLEPLDVAAYLEAGENIAETVESKIGHLYRTACEECGERADVKFFLWAKTHHCPECSTVNLMLPGPLVAGRGMKRHTHDVLVCATCRSLNQFLPDETPNACPDCGTSYEESHIGRKGACRGCCAEFLPAPTATGKRSEPPTHELIALEYQCAACKKRPGRRGRFFKQPDAEDFQRLEEARKLYLAIGESPFWPSDAIEAGDETNRLLRWGYSTWADLHNERQRLGLHLLASAISQAAPELRSALATTFSDLIRYQNLICRYDTAALKVLDVFSIHGFPVHRIQCEAALIGIPRVGSGAWRHWLTKYAAAKSYCEQPFETVRTDGRKQLIYTEGERIEAELVNHSAQLTKKRAALLRTASLREEPLPEASVDLVLTDPPYHDSVAYSELLDYLWAWLRRLIPDDRQLAAFENTRSDAEATGSKTAGRELEHYAEALSGVYIAATLALKPGQPFVFTFHDNDLDAYGAIAVALLDASLVPMRTIGCPSEMRGSIHINGSGSSRVDTVFVLRKPPASLPERRDNTELVNGQIAHLEAAGVQISAGDTRCLTYGVLTEAAIRRLRNEWDSTLPTSERLERACIELRRQARKHDTASEAERSEPSASALSHGSGRHE